MTQFIPQRFSLLSRAVVAALALSIPAASPALAGGTKVENSFFRYNGIKYFRGKAENVQLGSYGEKKTPVGKMNYLAVEKNIKAEHLEDAKVRVAPPVSINWSEVSEKELGAAGNYLGIGGKRKLTRKKAKEAKLKLVKFFINQGALKTLLNKKADGARKFMAKEGRDSRVVGEVWVVMEAELASKVSNAASLSTKAAKAGIEIELEAKAKNTKKESIVLSPDTTFAYLLYKAKFNKNDKVEDLEDDQKGLN